MADVEYIDCRVVIHDDGYASYTDDYNRSVRDADPEEDRRILQDDLSLLTIERIQHWIDVGHDCERLDLELLGKQLYRLLFHGKIGEEFRRSYDLFKRQAEDNPALRLRLTLVFHKKAEKLATYPWEFLYMPRKERGFFLAGQETNLILTRFVPESGIKDRLLETTEPLRILVAYSSPFDDALGQIDATEVIDAIEELGREQIVVEVVRNLTREQLKADITRFAPHVFHFIGHGEAGKIALVADEPELERRQLKEDASEASWCDSETVSDLFAEHKPSLVFLHACKGATSFASTLQSFTSTARRLVYWEIPAVIGMQFAIENADAATFSKCFYRELADGKPIDEAVSIGRHVLGSTASRGAWADPRFGTPLVYLQAYRAVIAAPARQPEGNGRVGEDEVGQEGASYDCPTPSCTMKIKAGFVSCPKCTNRIFRCPNEHPVAADWGTCPYCEIAIPPRGGEAAAARRPATAATSPANITPSGERDAAFG